MIEDTTIETYLSILPNKIEIYSFDTNNLKVLYKNEHVFQNINHNLDYNMMNQFLEDNIFKIEKLVGQFIKNIFLIIENEKNFNTNFSLRKKNYEEKVNKKNLENLLIDAKDLFKENFQEYRIMHMLISNYILDGKNYSKFFENSNVNKICLEMRFISIPIFQEIEKKFKSFKLKL